MISFDKALELISHQSMSLSTETVSLQASHGRICSQDMMAETDQPPFAASAMDGYAVRFADLAQTSSFKVIAHAPAGRPFRGDWPRATAIRVFTGSVLPDDADHVVIQEDVSQEGDIIHIREAQPRPRHRRPAGLDFKKGARLVAKGERLSAFAQATLASAGFSQVEVFKRPSAVIIANGDELRMPGEEMGDGDIICSTPFGLVPLIENWGGDATFAGIARDSEADIRRLLDAHSDADILIPVGGASVGDHDHMQSAFSKAGWAPVFAKVAVKPGKPTWFSQNGDRFTLGLPGNPASALVCAHLFLKPLIQRACGQTNAGGPDWKSAPAHSDIPANGSRESFMRGRRFIDHTGQIRITPLPNQDSSLITPFLTADVLIRRPPHATQVTPASGECVSYLDLD